MPDAHELEASCVEEIELRQEGSPAWRLYRRVWEDPPAVVEADLDVVGEMITSGLAS
jgi:hypothetical protein